MGKRSSCVCIPEGCILQQKQVKILGGDPALRHFSKKQKSELEASAWWIYLKRVIHEFSGCLLIIATKGRGKCVMCYFWGRTGFLAFSFPPPACLIISDCGVLCTQSAFFTFPSSAIRQSSRSKCWTETNMVDSSQFLLRFVILAQAAAPALQEASFWGKPAMGSAYIHPAVYLTTKIHAAPQTSVSIWGF